MWFLEFNEITLVFGPDCSCFPDSINEQFPFIHLSGLIHVFIFVSGPKDESLEGEGGPDSISTDSFTYPPSFTDLKSVAQYQPTVLLMKTIKEAFNWAIYPLLKSCTVPGLFGIVFTHTHTRPSPVAPAVSCGKCGAK